jgi:hypothetical protein
MQEKQILAISCKTSVVKKKKKTTVTNHSWQAKYLLGTFQGLVW